MHRGRPTPTVKMGGGTYGRIDELHWLHSDVWGESMGLGKSDY